MSTEPTFTREPPNPLVRLFLRLPPLLFRGWLAELLRWRCVLLLTTTGRQTGRPRTVGVSYMPLDGRYVIFSGWGTRSNWYRNLRANQQVVVRVGRRQFRATARLVEDPEQRRQLMLRMRERSSGCGPPRLLRPLLRLLRVFDYDREIALAVEQGGRLPVFELVPQGA